MHVAFSLRGWGFTLGLQDGVHGAGPCGDPIAPTALVVRRQDECHPGRGALMPWHFGTVDHAALPQKHLVLYRWLLLASW